MTDGDTDPVDIDTDPVDADSDTVDADSDAGRAEALREEADPVELGVTLLAHLEHEELSLADAVDRIETITTDPALTREILDTAEKRGVIDREDALIRTRGDSFVRFESQVVSRPVDADCRRCGSSLSTGYFIQFDAGEVGPFGSSCIRKVTGRD